MIKVSQLDKSFKNRGSRQDVLKQIDLTFKEGQIIGLVAPNGTGKSTLINLIMGYLQPTAGSIEIDGIRYKNESQRVKIHRKIVTLPDQFDLEPALSGLDHLRLYAGTYGHDKDRVKKIIDQLNMAGYVNKAVSSYSLGMRQRLTFAMVLAADADYLMLDEVMNGLDLNNVELLSDILRALRDSGKTLIIASHILANLQSIADRIIFLHHGKVVLDSTQQQEEQLFVKADLTQAELAKLPDVLSRHAINSVGYRKLFPVSEQGYNYVIQEIKKISPAEISFGTRNLEDYYWKFFGQEQSAV
ncbi:MAG: ABC transporter ATP-binding protein [Oenococcus sp.]|uniref:ABC transporter ATP-binding protein n=1 Tax=Oenococcus TaxID=46254 RepID=UPI0021E71A0A|nr:ABC transporter ATP-binding protein [Oenococcus kitaharae]MCV3296556.1 ABC transporter ATP-binding protein [Oenococcus kitaharae]